MANLKQTEFLNFKIASSESHLVLPYNGLKNNEDKSLFFYDVRTKFNSNLGVLSTEQAARFLFLNKTCPSTFICATKLLNKRLKTKTEICDFFIRGYIM